MKFSLQLLLAFLIFPFIGMAGKIVLNGETPYSIYVPANAQKSDKTASTELQTYLQRISGTKLPIVSKIPANRKTIFIGNSPEAKKLFAGIDFQTLKPDEILIKTIDGNLLLCGEGQRGPLYAVYTLLEEQFGVRFWSSDCETVPEKENLEIPKLSIRYASPFFMRGTIYYDFRKNPHFAAKMKLNGYFEPIPEEYGGNITFAQGKNHQGLTHTFHQLIPASVYFEKHPEFFSELKGKRVPKNGQLCLSNEEMRRELVKNALIWLRTLKNPIKLVSISQNDYLKGYCECPACTEAGKSGNQTDILIRFVNQVAEELEKEFPEVIVETLAYYYTFNPPTTVRPRHNVLIRFAPIYADYSRPLDGSGPNNPNLPFARNLKKWHEQTDFLAVWNYLLNTTNYFLPRPDMNTIADDLRFFAANGVKAVFEQGHPQDSALVNFGPLRYYMVAKLMWKPDLDENMLKQEFLNGYYGSGAKAVSRVIDIMNDEFNKNGKHLPIGLGGCGWFRTPQIKEAIVILEKAITDNSDLNQKERLRIVKTHFEFALLESLDPEKLSGEAKEAAIRLLHYLELIAKATNTKYYGEGKLFPLYAKELQEKFSGISIKDEKTASVPDFCRSLKPDQYYEFGPEKFRLHQKGTSTFIVTDPDSASEKLAKLKPENNWLLQFQLPPGKWTAMISMRLDGKTTGKIGTAGFYNESTGTTGKHRELLAKDISVGKFKWIKLGPFDVKKGYLYVAPVESALNTIDVERIILIRQEK